MVFPETEVLTSLVARVFRIDDVTTLDPARGQLLRYRGHLLDEDSASAYDQLAASVNSYELTPLFRLEQGEQVIYIVKSPPKQKPANPWVNVILFILTVFSVMLAGATPEGPLPPDAGGQMLALLKSIFTGWPFALSLMGILLAHEFGHYLVSRYHKTPATLPYFIPLPFPPLGTMGAAILMKGVPKNKRILFDIGVAGPLAGMLIAIPVLFYGLSLSSLDTIQATANSFIEGNSLIYLFAKFAIFGKFLPEPATFGNMPPFLYWLRYFFTGQPSPIGGTDVFIHPVAFAGWAGLLVTALNLVPAGTLDGGHVVYSLFGEKARKAFPYIIGIMAVLGIFWSGWWLWAFLLFWLGRVNAETLDQITPLDPKRRAVAVFVIILFLLVFTPVPFSLLIA
ncbi:MAG: site-2 protease family protein [Anaerolineales bacterium]|nr:site-2 protease family protein [Anaerolineales bacterium]